MLKSLAIKELRESVGIVAVAVLAAAYTLAMITGMRIFPVFFSMAGAGFPFVSDAFSKLYVVVIGALAIALGLKQAAGEGRRDTYYFLLHRPASRRSIFGTKLIVGAAFVLIVGGLLVLLYAIWAATPGNVAAPFYWSMTAWAWQLWLCMPLLYLGAFLSGIRPARWFGTRLMPLAAAGFATFLIVMSPWWWLTAVALAICAAIIVVSIFYYAEQRDY
jgi:ABC-type transport system involved in multi-copper enzyme maturation permease subunit